MDREHEKTLENDIWDQEDSDQEDSDREHEKTLENAIWDQEDSDQEEELDREDLDQEHEKTQQYVGFVPGGGNVPG